MRFLHTADIHLDAPFAYLPADRRRLKRQALRDSLRQVIDLAIDKRVDAVLIAGDLFDTPRPLLDTVSFVCSEMRRLADNRINVFVVPGNHDFVETDSVWRQATFPTNVHVFVEDAWTVIEREIGLVWGVACHRSGQERNVLKDLPATDGAVALLHGSHQLDFYEGSRCYPFEIKDLSGISVSYLALGHHHNYGQPHRRRPAYYSGSPEGLCFQEEGGRHVLLVTTDDGPAKVEPLALGKYPYRTESLDCTTFSSSEEVRQAITKLGDPNTLLRVTLGGAPALTLDLDREVLAAGLDTQLFYLDIRENLALPDDLTSGEELTVKALFAKRMAARLSVADGDPERALVSLATRLGLAALERRLK